MIVHLNQKIEIQKYINISDVGYEEKPEWTTVKNTKADILSSTENTVYSLETGKTAIITKIIIVRYDPKIEFDYGCRIIYKNNIYKPLIIDNIKEDKYLKISASSWAEN